jgi:hypothetical protein
MPSQPKKKKQDPEKIDANPTRVSRGEYVDESLVQSDSAQHWLDRGKSP